MSGKIDPATAPAGQGTRYPAPHHLPCMARQWLKLGEAAGLTQFGVNLVTLPPGTWSSQRHWHAKEDEFVFVVSGELVLVTDAGATPMQAGDSAGFKAGVRDAHHLRNESKEPAVFLVVGSRDDSDWGEYADIDMAFGKGNGTDRYGKVGDYTRRDGSPL